jgi:arylsulfatase A-like enzyme/Tfp pilus assembly protein PilF
MAMNPRRHTLRGLWASILLASAGCAPQAPDGPPALVLIVMDTVRADHLGFLGDERARTPNLDGLAATSTVLADLNTPVPVTLPAVSSLLTAQWPEHHGVRDNAGFVLDDRAVTLAEAMKARGYRTAAIVASEVLAADRGIAQGFDDYDDDFSGDYPVYRKDLRPFARQMESTRRRATEVTDLALARIADFGARPYFLMVHYFDAHSHYDPPPEFAALLPGRPYDGEIAYLDHEIGRLLRFLEGSGAVIAVCADHGEGLGEHGETEHGFLLFQSTLHVPGILHVPNRAPRRDNRPRSLVDLSATIADLFGLDLGPQVDGVAISDELEDERILRAETLRTRLSYDWAPLFALRSGSKKLISGAGRLDAFDLAKDPGETSAVLEPPGPAWQALRSQLLDWSASFDMESIARQARARVDTEEDRAEALATLGYTSVASPNETDRQRPHPQDAIGAWQLRQRNKARLRIALTLLEEGQLSMARTTLDSLLSGAPDAGTYYLSSRSWRALGDTERAAADLDRALLEDANHVPSLRELVSRQVRAGRVDDATAALRQLHRLLPDDPDTLYNLGVALARQGDRNESTALLRRFLEVAPQDARAPQVRSFLEP